MNVAVGLLFDGLAVAFLAPGLLVGWTRDGIAPRLGLVAWLATVVVRQLRAVARGQPYVLLSPYPGLPTPVVASAWGVQPRLADASDPRLARFIAAYQRGPQTPEPDAPCTGGIGHPQT